MIIKKPKIYYIKSFKNHNGQLFTIEKNNFIKKFDRVFYIKANKGAIRGNHAHKKCIQYLICINGEIEVNCLTNKKSDNFVLKSPKNMLKISPFTWVTQKYLKKDSILMCLCTDKYNEKDYIRKYDEYINFFLD